VEKAPGFTPEGLINEIRRNARYTAADFKRIASEPPVDAGTVMRRLREGLDSAEAFVARMPTDKIGLLFPRGWEGRSTRSGAARCLRDARRTAARTLAAILRNRKCDAGALYGSEALTVLF
jgi:hypothetical protein